MVVADPEGPAYIFEKSRANISRAFNPRGDSLEGTTSRHPR